MNVPSPCISVCRMDAASGWCEGCLRTLDEIAAWSLLDDEGKRAVWAQLPARRARLRPRDGERGEAAADGGGAAR
ncbi:MAG: DUF1289 domain-containing protein [Rubrivivax sp.]|nr:DUF1289 domain-containing protein [Rubrivivax sp.]